MLAFKMKKPKQNIDFERMLAAKVDTARWGPQGRELISKLHGMRQRMKEASGSFSEKGADECREVFGRYQALVYQSGIVCAGIDLKQLQLRFEWSDAFDPDESHRGLCQVLPARTCEGGSVGKGRRLGRRSLRERRSGASGLLLLTLWTATYIALHNYITYTL